MDEWLAMPPITGLKSDSEKFAGAVNSYSCEALMKDKKALQAGTSHFLGQNFSKQFELTFQSEDGTEEYAWNTSWGVSTRLVGGVVMTHGDDSGLVIPPRLAPTQVVIIPILVGEETSGVLEKADEVLGRLEKLGVRAKIDSRDNLSPGAKYFEWERKGVPFRVEIGPKDLQNEQLALVRRLTPEGENRKAFLPETEAITKLPEKLEYFQDDLLEAARTRRDDSTVRGVNSFGELKEAFDSGAGFVYTGWSGNPAVEETVKEQLKATIRVLPGEEFLSESPPRKCVSGDADSVTEVVWARAY
jgi:prolyl-tRNA synthetase